LTASDTGAHGRRAWIEEADLGSIGEVSGRATGTSTRWRRRHYEGAASTSSPGTTTGFGFVSSLETVIRSGWPP
jgi:hypothetical protein